MILWRMLMGFAVNRAIQTHGGSLKTLRQHQATLKAKHEEDYAKACADFEAEKKAAQDAQQMYWKLRPQKKPRLHWSIKSTNDAAPLYSGIDLGYAPVVLLLSFLNSPRRPQDAPL